jgi:hypothetical protein
MIHRHARLVPQLDPADREGMAKILNSRVWMFPASTPSETIPQSAEHVFDRTRR